MYTDLSNVPPKTKQTVMYMKCDSAATRHYVHYEDRECLSGIQPYKGPSVILPDAETLAPSHQGFLPLHKELSVRERNETVLPRLKSALLISLGHV